MADMAMRGKPVEERFMYHVAMIPESTCWHWIGHTAYNGYGRYQVKKGVCAIAHRLSYELFVGPIPDGLHIDHVCRNRGCVNPRHLEAVSCRENIMRSPVSVAGINSRKTHCNRGHEYTRENTRMSRGKRYCEACRPFWRRKKVG